MIDPVSLPDATCRYSATPRKLRHHYARGGTVRPSSKSSLVSSHKKMRLSKSTAVSNSGCLLKALCVGVTVDSSAGFMLEIDSRPYADCHKFMRIG